jgi:hypothetical protein
MTRPQVRFTVRRLLVAVAVIGLILGGLDAIRRRGAQFKILAAYHWGKCPSRLGGHDSPHYQWHSNQARKYWVAADRPWMFVTTDTPPALNFGEHPCLCTYQFSSTDLRWRRDVPLMSEFLERQGWDVFCGERMDNMGGIFDASARKGPVEIEVEATTSEAAWRKLFEQVEGRP